MNEAVRRAHELKSTIENEKGSVLTEHEAELMFLCIKLGFNDSASSIVVKCSGDIFKEQYLIACILDGVDETFITAELAAEPDISLIKEKRYDYLIENFRKEDPAFRELEMNLEDCQRQISEFKESAEQMQSLLETYKHEENDLKEARQKLITEIGLLKNEKKQLQQKLMKANELADEVIEMPQEDIQNSSRPRTIYDKIRYLFSDEDTSNLKVHETRKRTFDDSGLDMVSLLCDPRLSLEQVKELKQGLQDGISVKEIKQIADPTLSIDVVREIRRFISIKEDLPYTECISDNVSEKSLSDEYSASVRISGQEDELQSVMDGQMDPSEFE